MIFQHILFDNRSKFTPLQTICQLFERICGIRPTSGIAERVTRVNSQVHVEAGLSLSMIWWERIIYVQAIRVTTSRTPLVSHCTNVWTGALCAVTRYGKSVRYIAVGHGAGIGTLLQVTVNLWVTASQPSSPGPARFQHSDGR